jgi:hypothetical protein
MKYTVLWAPSAEAELTQLWLDAVDRNSIRTSADDIEQDLERDPLKVGESRSGNRRILLRPPLGVKYEVREDDRVVRVFGSLAIPDAKLGVVHQALIAGIGRHPTYGL